MKKRIIALLLALCLMAGLVPGVSAARYITSSSCNDSQPCMSEMCIPLASAYAETLSHEPFTPDTPPAPVVNHPVKGETFSDIGNYTFGEEPYLNWCGDTEYAAWIGFYALENSQSQRDSLIREFEDHYGFAPTAQVKCEYLGEYQVENYANPQSVYHYTITDRTYVLILNKMYEVYYQICDDGDIWVGFCGYGDFYDHDFSSDPHYSPLRSESMELFLELTGATENQIYEYDDEFDYAISAAGAVRTLYDKGPISVYYAFIRGPHILDILGNPFTDVPAGAFYEDPVLWAVENSITTGATADSFNPNDSCLRAHVVTFLHRAAQNPEPSSTNNPFTDVKSSDFFYKPVLWAVEKNITNGTSATTFGSYDVCNRAAVVTFLWRAAGSPEPESTDNPFVDVKETDFFYKPVLWAIENGITNGVDATHFGPTTACNRAQVVTFLYRAYN